MFTSRFLIVRLLLLLLSCVMEKFGVGGKVKKDSVKAKNLQLDFLGEHRDYVFCGGFTHF